MHKTIVEYIFKGCSNIKLFRGGTPIQTQKKTKKPFILGVLMLFLLSCLILCVSNRSDAHSLLVLNETPLNGSLHVSIYLSEISFYVSGSPGDSVYYRVTAYPDFIGGTRCGTSSSGETIHILRRNGELTNGSTYIWWVNVTDGSVWVNNTYSFSTIGEVFQGYTLFTPIHAHNSSTFLINKDGKTIHTWDTDFTPSLGVYMVENGSILRPCTIINQEERRAIQKFTWDGTLVWDFHYSGDEYWQTHDIAPLPNGNVLILALEKKTAAECIAAGRNPALLLDDELWPVYIVEVHPTGFTTGDIVWEWHLWDHLVQDYNPHRDNYGVIKVHPELLDINFMMDGSRDWIHPNTIHYSPELDQVILCSRHLAEFWIIDHGISTEDAAKHSGGAHGRGGDFLYRWGNPQSYQAGDASDQRLFGPHDPQWITPGCPGEGHILIFNNGWGRPGGDYSTIDEIIPPIDADGNYSLIPGSAYGPDNLTWQFKADIPYSFNANFISGCERLPNGNTLICDGPSGHFFEVSMQGDIIWSYNNIDPYPGCRVFRIRRYYSPFCPPITPLVSGPKNATVGIPYTYSIISTDPDGDAVYYNIDWGDNTSENWIGPFRSGEQILINHTWEMEKTYSIQCQAKDRYDSMSNWSTFTANIGTPYQPNNPFPVDGAVEVDLEVNLSWSGGHPDPDEIVTYDIYFGSINPPPKISNNQTITYLISGNLEFSRTYYWKIIGWDTQGRSTTGQTWEFTTIIDNTSPITIVSLNGSVGNDGWFISPVIITLEANDTQSGLNTTFYKINNGLWTVYDIPVVVSIDGFFSVSYYSIDQVGNIEDIKEEFLKIDTKAPHTTYSLSGILGNGGWYVSNVTISFFAVDTTSGIIGTYYRVNEGDWNLYSLPIVITNNGVHRLQYYSIDKAGNRESINDSIVFGIDIIPPTTTHSFFGTGLNQWYSSNVTVIFVVMDSNPFEEPLLLSQNTTCENSSGVNHTYYRIDNEIWYEYTTPFYVSVDGVYNLRYFSVDVAGNVEAIKGPFILKIDQTPPTIDLFIMSCNVWKTQWLLQAIVNDTTSGVSKVEFYIDDLLLGTAFYPGPYEWFYEGCGSVACAVVFDDAGNSKISPIVTCQESQYQSKNSYLFFKRYITLLKIF